MLAHPLWRSSNARLSGRWLQQWQELSMYRGGLLLQQSVLRSFFRKCGRFALPGTITSPTSCYPPGQSGALSCHLSPIILSDAILPRVLKLSLTGSSTALEMPARLHTVEWSTFGCYTRTLVSQSPWWLLELVSLHSRVLQSRGWSYVELSFWPNCLSQLLLICPSPPIMCVRDRWYWDGSTDLQPSSKCLLPTG